VSGKMELEVGDGGVAWLRFLASDRRNPFGVTFARELAKRMREAAARDDVRVLLLSGGEHFCGGGDLIEFRGQVAEGARATWLVLEDVNAAMLAVYGFPKPCIAVVRGACFGAGMSLALVTDFSVSGESAKFCQVFVNIGGAPDSGSSCLLQRRIGAARARTLIFTGRTVDAEQALQIGLADEVHPDSALEERALLLARELAGKPSFGLFFAKQLVRSAAETSFAEALQAEGLAQSLILQGHDFPEAMAAFTEKRKPLFRDM